jgi:gamma-glutamyltranspeptidase/glutathione hydrolase
MRPQADNMVLSSLEVRPMQKSAAPQRHSAICLAVLLTCGLVALAQADDGDRHQESARSDWKSKPLPASGPAFRKGVVSVANPYGAEAGARILEQGGNAVDAAVAIAYALNVVEPQSAGVGGGGFMMIHLADRDDDHHGKDDDDKHDRRHGKSHGKSHGKHHGERGRTFFIETREKAPTGATPDMFVGQPFSQRSLQGVAVGVPGMVRGTAMAVEKYGKLRLAQVLQPAIKLADDGFAATPRFVNSTACDNPNSRALNSPESAEYFCPGGQFREVGALVDNKPLAETFRLIAANGPDCFYKYMPDKGCDIAKGIIEGQSFTRPQQANGKGGTMTYADLENYRAIEREAIEGTYRGYRIKSMGPPSSGALTLIQALKMIERFPIGDESQGFGFGSVRTINVMASAMRLAFADRSIWMGDSDFVPVPSKGLLDPRYVALRGAPIMADAALAATPVPDDPRPFETAGLQPATRLAVAAPFNGPGETTTHFSVVDGEGNMVSYTNTIESGYGIGVFAGYKRTDGTFRSLGFLLNNELTDFNTTPTTNPFTGTSGFNDVQPNKRPRSSMTPSMLFSPDGTPLIAYGSPGGSTIINSVFNVTLNLIDHKMTLQQAIDAPRVSVTSPGTNITIEDGFAPSTLSGLAGLGYNLVPTTDIGSVQAVLVDPKTGKQYGAADARREGTVIGLPRSRRR